MSSPTHVSLSSDAPPPTTQPTKKHHWAAALVLHRGRSLLSRLAFHYQRLRNLPRHIRRRLQRKAALTLAGAALLFTLGRAPAPSQIAHAADITVDEINCTLIDAIRSANNDGSYGSCMTGDGDDTIYLQADVTLTAAYDYHYYADTGLPLITSQITIEGNGHTIARDTDPSTTHFRLLAVSSSGDLTINNTTLTGGYLTDSAEGGAIYNNGLLTVNNSLLTGNTVGAGDTQGNGGGIFNDGYATVNNSQLIANYARRGGGLFNETGTAVIHNSLIEGNTGLMEGGGLYNDGPTMLVTNSVLRGNKSDEGGGINNNSLTGSVTVENSLIEDNTAYSGGGGIHTNISDVTITNSTIRDNKAEYGAGVYARLEETVVTITNSTISGNEASSIGGGIYNGDGTMSIYNSTISDNSAHQGGGIYDGHGNITLGRTLVSGNTAAFSSEIRHHNGNIYANAHNLFAHNGLDSGQAFYNFTPGADDINATSDNDDILLATILDTTLRDNGGPLAGPSFAPEPIPTHALPAGSPAVDAVPSADCTAAPVDGLDQRGAPRNINGDGVPSTDECDIGAFERQPAIFMSAEKPGVTSNSVAFGREDILLWDGYKWSLFFDGSSHGLSNAHDINGIHINHINDADDLYLTFFQNKVNVPGIGNVLGHDAVHFDGNGFSLFFDGSDAELTTVSEKLDGLAVLDGKLSPIGNSCQAYLLLSTFGNGRVQNHDGTPLRFRGEDILGFCATNTGEATAGFWHMVLDGSAEGMPKNSTFSLSTGIGGRPYYLTTKGTFNVDNAAGGHSMVYRYDPSTGEFDGPHFSAPASGLNQKVNALHIAGDLP